MKKIRFVPYGYTVCQGHITMESEEADVIKSIFAEYIGGASLKELAQHLSKNKVPYTEKSCVWDKARIARIIDNSKYIGEGDYEAIIDKDTFETAVAVKEARNRNRTACDCDGIAAIRNRVRCASCGAPMIRHVCSKRKTKERWECSNNDCGLRVSISDTDLLQKVNLIINRIIENSALLIPEPRRQYTDSAHVIRLQNEISAEMSRERPNEDLIINLISEIASQLYAESNAAMITAGVVRKRAEMMHPQDAFNSEYFAEIGDLVVLGADGAVELITKTNTKVGKGQNSDGSYEDSQTDGNDN